MMLEQTADGIVLSVQAQPRARKNAIIGRHADRLKVAVTQAPEKGKANAALIKLLAAELGLSRTQIALISGPTAGHKRFLITGIDWEDLRGRLAAYLGDDAANS